MVVVPQLCGHKQLLAADRSVSEQLVERRTDLRFVAIPTNGDPLGALNFYAERPHAFNTESEELGLVYVTHAALAWTALRHATQFRSALASRDIIGQAKGTLMERYHIDAGEAFNLLRKLSQQSNTPVTQISRRLVEADHPNRD